MATCGVTFTEEKREFEIFPTVYPAKEFDPKVDAETLYNAMKGVGIKKKPLIDIVTTRSTGQLKEIEVAFKSKYDEDLIKRLKGKLRGNFQRVVVERFYERVEHQALILHKALSKGGTDEQALIDVICSKTEKEMKILNETYEKIYNLNLIKHIESETSGNLRKLLVSIAMANRDKAKPDVQLAAEDAKKLYDAGEAKEGTDEEVWNEIFSTRGPMQLKITWLKYRQLTDGKLILDVIKKEFKGKLRSAFLTITQYIKDPITYNSEVMFDSMSGLGTNDKRLIRAVVSCCETNLKTVRERYDKIHKTPLIKQIKKETSGDYEKILVALVSDPK